MGSVPHNRPLKILTAHHLALLSNTKTPETLAMGVCSSAEQPFEQAIAEPENDLNSDEPFEDDVTGENSDSSSAATADGSNSLEKKRTEDEVGDLIEDLVDGLDDSDSESESDSDAD